MTNMEKVPQGQPKGQPPPPDMIRMRNVAQIALARAAYPGLDGNAAMKQWVTDGFSARFSDYFENASNLGELSDFDAKTPGASQELLKKILSYQKAPENLH